MYYIIRKLNVVDGQVTYTSVGYVTTQENMYKCIDLVIIGNMRRWVAENLNGLNAGTITAVDFITLYGIAHVYISDTITDNIDGQGLLEITDFAHPEGV